MRWLDEPPTKPLSELARLMEQERAAVAADSARQRRADELGQIMRAAGGDSALRERERERDDLRALQARLAELGG